MDCLICMGLLQNPQKVPCCSISFCKQCLQSWTSVRNCCPHCIKPLSSIPKNQLTKMASQQFDNGSLMLQSELASVLQRYNMLLVMVGSKREASKNYKNSFPRSQLIFLQQKMEQLQHNIQIASSAMHENDRNTVSTCLQVSMELISNIQAVLNGESAFEYYDEYSDQEEYDYEQQQQYYWQYKMEIKESTCRQVSKQSKRKLYN